MELIDYSGRSLMSISDISDGYIISLSNFSKGCYFREFVNTKTGGKSIKKLVKD